MGDGSAPPCVHPPALTAVAERQLPIVEGVRGLVSDPSLDGESVEGHVVPQVVEARPLVNHADVGSVVAGVIPHVGVVSPAVEEHRGPLVVGGCV